jgi:hypothetical protein
MSGEKSLALRSTIQWVPVSEALPKHHCAVMIASETGALIACFAALTPEGWKDALSGQKVRVPIGYWAEVPPVPGGWLHFLRSKDFAYKTSGDPRVRGHGCSQVHVTGADAQLQRIEDKLDRLLTLAPPSQKYRARYTFAGASGACQVRNTWDQAADDCEEMARHFDGHASVWVETVPENEAKKRHAYSIRPGPVEKTRNFASKLKPTVSVRGTEDEETTGCVAKMLGESPAGQTRPQPMPSSEAAGGGAVEPIIVQAGTETE